LLVRLSACESRLSALEQPAPPIPVPEPIPPPPPAAILRPFSVSVVQAILLAKRDSRTVGKVCSFGDSLTVTRAYRRAEVVLSPADALTFDWMHGHESGDANGFTLAGGSAITAQSGAGWADDWITTALANPRVSDSQFIDWLFNSVATIDLVKQRGDQTVALGAVPIFWTVPPRVAPSMPDYDAVYTEPHNARVRALCDAQGWPCIDLYAAFTANPNWRTELVSEDGIHLTLAGYDLRTTLLVQMVGQLKRLAVDTLPAPQPVPVPTPTPTPPPTPGTRPRALITLDDLVWQGMTKTPDGDYTPEGGSSSYACGALAIRYVNGERRLLIPNFKYGAHGEFWGDLVEYREPGTRYSGPDPTEAPALIETRRWPMPEWTAAYANSPAWANSANAASGAKLGTILWDERRQVLWYQVYGYYTGRNEPFLAAVQLLDSPHPKGRTNCAVGQSFGPWWYRSTDMAGASYWKQVNYFLATIPASAQADLGGRKVLVGGATGAVVDVGHLGPGMHAIEDWPALTDAPDSVIPAGLAVADYSGGSGVTPYNARRNRDYTPFNYSSADISQFFPADGYWLGSLDRVVGLAWIETATKHGLLLYGVQAGGRICYGDNPISVGLQTPSTLTHRGATAVATTRFPHPLSVGTAIRVENATPAIYNGSFVVSAVPTPTSFEYALPSDPGQDASGTIYFYGWDPHVIPDLVDPSRANPEHQHGYLAERFTGQVWAFDPDQIREVGRGSRAGNNTGINPIELGDWHTRWPNLPWAKQDARLVADNVSNRLCWDARAQELLWLVPQSVSAANPRLTVNVFTVRG
jgi:hypothetical protein